MRRILFLLLMGCSCLGYGQERSFDDYIGHFTKPEPDKYGTYIWQSDTNGKEVVSEEYVDRYLSGCVSQSDPYSYRYYHGLKTDNSKYIVALVVRECDDFETKFGKGVREYFLVTYTPEGKTAGQRLIGNESADRHITICFPTEPTELQEMPELEGKRNFRDPNLAFVTVTETRFLQCTDPDEKIYEGLRYEKVYTVANSNGQIAKNAHLPSAKVKISMKEGFSEIERMPYPPISQH